MIRVLVVDTSEARRSLVELHLHRAGYAVQTVATIEDAKGLLQGEKPLLLIIDPFMESDKGFELIRWLYGEVDSDSIGVMTLAPRDPESKFFRAWQADPYCVINLPLKVIDLLTLAKRTADSVRARTVA